MSEGKIVEYIDQRKIVLAVCLKDKTNKLQLLTSSNHEASIPPKRALLVSTVSLPLTSSREEIVGELRAVEQKRLELMKTISVHDLWELTYDEKEAFTFADLAALAFGNHITDDHISALMRALFADRIYFKLKDNRFVPNSPEKAEQAIHAIEAAEQREQEISHGGWFLKELANGRIPEDPLLRERVVEILIQLALYGEDAPDVKLGKEMLSRAGIKDIAQAHNLLVTLKEWDEDENLDLHRLDIRTEYAEEALEEAERIAQVDPDYTGREDLTDLPTFTIDGPFTRDFDDALSLEPIDRGYRLGIHITDVTPFIQLDGALDKEAFARASSIYLPATQIPMLPPELSNNALSLVKDAERLAVSVFCDFDANLDLFSHRFSLTVVKIEKQHTYDEIDKMYLEDPLLATLYQISQGLRQKRAANGALLIPLPEIHFTFDDQSRPQVSLIDQDSPARIMVSECMILYNWLAARFAVEAGIPILYRRQEPPQERLSLNESPYIYYVFQQRRKIRPLSIDTAPQPHSGIGVDAYTNATSPLRRYMDMLVQRQIFSGLTAKKPVYAEPRIKEMGISVQQTLRDIAIMKRNRIRYWVLKYLAERINERLPALVFQKLRLKYLVILTDLLFVAELPLTGTHDLSPGEQITIVVKKSDPRADTLTIELGS
jgi:exoribonuclease II